MLVLGLSMLALPVDCLGDFGPRGLSVQYTHDVRGCPPAHIGRLWLSMAVYRPWQSVIVRQHTQDIRGCPCASVDVRHHTQEIRGCPSVHISACWCLDSARWSFPWTVWVILAHVGCLISTHRTSVGVRQHTQDVRVCPSAHTGRPWLSVCVRVCPSAHTGRPWLSISTHISTLVLGLSTLTLPVDCSGNFGARGLSVQYTQDVCGCPPAHTGRPWLSVCVRVCPSMSVSTHRMSVAVHQYTYQHVAPWNQHAGPSSGLFGTSVAVCGCPSAHRTSMAVCVCPCVSVCVRQHTQDVRVCPSVHTGRPCVSVSTHRTSVAVRVCPSAHTGCPWLSISTHIRALVLGLSTLTLPADCSGDFGPRGLSIQYTQDVCGCPPAHTGRPWLSVCVRVCPSVSVSTHRTSVAVHQYTYQHVGPWTQHSGPSCGLFG
ncbi:hypothetical protein YC2023_066397 [Brassica napus]